MLNFMARGVPFYNRDELDRIRMQVTAALKELNMVRRNRYSYWINRYLENQTGKIIPAIVLNAMKSRYRVILTDFYTTVEMKREKDSNLSSGDKIKVRVVKVDPWNDILKLEHVRD